MNYIQWYSFCQSLLNSISDWNLKSTNLHTNDCKELEISYGKLEVEIKAATIISYMHQQIDHADWRISWCIRSNQIPSMEKKAKWIFDVFFLNLITLKPKSSNGPKLKTNKLYQIHGLLYLAFFTQGSNFKVKN